jgi:hypothetical protein
MTLAGFNLAERRTQYAAFRALLFQRIGNNIIAHIRGVAGAAGGDHHVLFAVFGDL